MTEDYEREEEFWSGLETLPIDCVVCEGDGWVVDIAFDDDGAAYQIQVQCENCLGTGKVQK